MEAMNESERTTTTNGSLEGGRISSRLVIGWIGDRLSPIIPPRPRPASAGAFPSHPSRGRMMPSRDTQSPPPPRTPTSTSIPRQSFLLAPWHTLPMLSILARRRLPRDRRSYPPPMPESVWPSTHPQPALPGPPDTERLSPFIIASHRHNTRGAIYKTGQKDSHLQTCLAGIGIELEHGIARPAGSCSAGGRGTWGRLCSASAMVSPSPSESEGGRASVVAR